jgi:hypothetical protein
MPALTTAERRTTAVIEAELRNVIRYDDESIVHSKWVRQRYDCGCYLSYGPARQAVVKTAWHEAGHAVAALTLGTTFTSVSIHHSHRSEGRVHAVARGCEESFIIDAAGQIAERLMNWTVLERDDDLREWLATWKDDGGDARKFRQAIRTRFGANEIEAWRFCESQLTPKRLQIRELARALLVHPQYLRYNVAAALCSAAHLA